MATWTEQLTAQSGDFTPILSTITQGDGECLQAIYDQLLLHSAETGSTLSEYATKGRCAAIDQDGVVINGDSIATLKAVGVILTNDNIHIGLTPLGLSFMEAIPTVVNNYNPSQFLQQMMASTSFDAWLGNFTPLQQTKLITVATNAKMDANWTVMQSVYDSYKAGVAPSSEAITEWQGYADANDIELTF